MFKNINFNRNICQSVLRIRNSSNLVRTDWKKNEIEEIFNLPLLDLVHRASTIHRKFFNPKEVQQCTLISIKTGGCVEDCKYCSQSSRYKTHVKPTPTMQLQEVVESAKKAKEAGSTRFCMGAAWRDVGETKDRKAFGSVLEMIRQVKAMDLEVCCTLGMLTADQAIQLKDAGLTAYNHNLDTSREFYPSIITSRSYDDRLRTIENVRNAGLSVCCGGILGLGEEATDRIGLLHTLATMSTHPESVPINALVPISGTPLGPDTNTVTIANTTTSSSSTQNNVQVDSSQKKGEIPTAIEMTRMIATARCIMPRTMLRLSAGRMSYSEAEQGFMMLAGANSIFYGEQLLTTQNPEADRDRAMFTRLGLQGKKPFSQPLNPPKDQEEEELDFINQTTTATISHTMNDIYVTKVKNTI